MGTLVAYQVYRGATLLRTVLDVEDDGAVVVACPRRRVDLGLLARAARELHAGA